VTAVPRSAKKQAIKSKLPAKKPKCFGVGGKTAALERPNAVFRLIKGVTFTASQFYASYFAKSTNIYG
jgi:hypothetical protein